VSLILDFLASRMTVAEILQEHPGLEEADVLACIAYGSEMVRERLVDIPPRAEGVKPMKTPSAGDTRKGPLPGHLKPLFWDYEFQRLRWGTDRDLIIARVLASGDWKATGWLRRRVDSEALRAWIEARHGRGLDPRRLRFWELILDLPHRRVNEWLRAMDRP
jgi:hypothetical protein